MPLTILGNRRRAHRKSRTGCKQCKERKVKCDENKPCCGYCSRNDWPCSFSFSLDSTIQPRTPPSSEGERALTESVQSPSSYEIESVASSPSHSTDLEWIDLELLHHYTTSTYSTIDDRPATLQTWKETVPKIALEHPFLMYGLLAVSALHLASIHPKRARALIAVATERQTRALPIYQAQVLAANEQNCHALFLFSKLLAIQMFAMRRLENPIRNNDITIGCGALNWLGLIRGGCSLLFSVWHHIAPGPLHALVTLKEGPVNKRGGLNDLQLTALLPLLTSPDLSPSMSEIYCTTLNQLRETFFAASIVDERASARDSACHWPAVVSQDYLHLLNREETPEALILLAHYCVLLKHLEDCWFMQGHAAWMIDLIQHRLDKGLRKWIEWPLQNIVQTQH